MWFGRQKSKSDLPIKENPDFFSACLNTVIFSLFYYSAASQLYHHYLPHTHVVALDTGYGALYTT